MGHSTPFGVTFAMDWFDERMHLDYNNENLADLPHQEYLRRLEGRIMMFVSSAEDGIGHLELSSKVKIDRKNLTPHLKRLMKKGLVRRGNGKRGKYYPASKKYRGILITADILSQAAASRILANEDFPIDSPYFDNGTIENYSIEKTLFTFSNGLGAIITYLLIQSMNQSNEIPGRDSKNAEEQDINVKRWFNDGISTLGTYLLALFKDYIACDLVGSYSDYVDKDGTYNSRRVKTDLVRHMRGTPLFTLDEKLINYLMKGFCNIYPSIGAHLEQIRSRLPSIVNREAARDQYRRIRDKQQKICKHDFRPPRDTFYSTNYKADKLLHCTKCHKTMSRKT